MTYSQAPSWNRNPLALMAAICLAYAAASALCIALTRQTEGIATVWLADGVLAVGFLVLPARWRAPCAALCFVINIASGMAWGGDKISVGFSFACLNLIESATSAWLTRIVVGPRLWIRGMARLGLVCLASVAVAAVIGMAAASIFHDAFQRPWHAVFVDWLFADGLGTAVVMSTLLVLRQSWNQTWEGGAGLVESTLLLLTIPAAAMINYFTLREPVMFLAFPLMVLIAFRMGPRGAAFGALVLFGSALPIAIKGPVPDFVNNWDLGSRIRLMQVFIGAVFSSSLATALVVDQQARLRRLLVRRQRMARASRARAHQANAAKSEFLAMMSHEIRTPLTSVLGFTGVLLGRGDMPPDARRQIELIDRAGETLLAMVNDVLDVSKIEAGEVELTTAPADVVELAQGVLEIIAPAAQTKGLKVVFDADAQAAWRMVDGRYLRQVLMNLLSNAVKFTDHGVIALNLYTKTPGQLRLEISDSGVGIADETIERLFRRFAQADGSVSRQYGGTGLGLAIVKGLAEKMGGRIEVSSQVGFGSTFTVVLPAKAAKPPTAKPGRTLSSQLRGVRALVVDDHPANREIAKAMLDAAGCVVTTAESGEAALEALRGAKFDIVLLDVHMPQMDGLATVVKINALPGAPPVVAMSADVLPRHVARCLAAGMVDHIAKPIPRDKLYATVARWSGKRRPGEVTSLRPAAAHRA